MSATDAIGIGTGGSWQSLRLLNSYRIFVASLLLAGFVADVPGMDLGAVAPGAFYTVAAAYIVTALLIALGIYLRRPPLDVQAHLHLYGDILFITLATHMSGGVTSGLAVLLVPPVAGAGMVLPHRHALLYAALATLLLLASEVAVEIRFGAAAAGHSQAALLGAALFISALLAAMLARRSAASAEVAQRRAHDVRKLSALNEQIIQHMESGIVVVDPHDRIMLTNASADELLGDGRELLGIDLADAQPELAAALRMWRENPDTAFGPIRPTDQSARPLQPQFTSLGELGTLIALEDAAFLEEQLQQLKLASLGRLTASIAHEIRNPLSAIQHASQLLAESPDLPKADRRFTRIIVDQGRRMNTIIDNVLQLSRRQGESTVALDLAAWLPDFISEIRDERPDKAARLEFEPPAAPLRVRIDPGNLRQVLRNLCDNAFQHGHRTDGSGIRIRLACGQDAAGQPFIDITDNGEPISEEQTREMFEPFYTTSHSGTGLGLFLARELCEVNRGHLRYHADPTGNRFRITLPAEGGTP